MSPVTVPQSELSVRRPTSDDIIYDLFSDHIGLDPALYGNFRTPLADTIERLDDISVWREDWDGRGAAKPNINSIVNAWRWIKGMRVCATLTRNRWVEPHTVADTNGNIVFEWSEQGRTLSIYVSPQTVEYLKVEGPNIFDDMEDGEVTTPGVAQDLWRWLMGQE